MPSLSHHLLLCACNNRWANHRLLQTCAKLGPHGFAARRTSFFPSVKATLNHILTVDWYYVDAIERGLHGRPPNDEWRAYFEPAEPFGTCTELAAAQQACDERLIGLCRRLSDELLDLQVPVPREEGLKPERLDRLLAHLLQHQIHHRGQVHAMLAGTDIPPPQLDEFFCASDAARRAGDFEELGFREAVLWEPQGRPSRHFDARP